MNKRTIFWLMLLAILIAAGLYVVNNARIFSNNNIYYGYYDNVRGLQESSPIYLKGVKVGRVEEIDLNIKDKVRVIFEIDKTVSLKQGTKAVITMGDINGSKSIRLELGNGFTALQPEGTIIAAFDSTVTENFHAKITPMIQTGEILLQSTDSALNNFNMLLRQGWGQETRESFASINEKLTTAATVSGKSNQKIQHFQNTINSLNNATESPAKRNAEMNKSLTNLENQSKQATQKNISHTLRDLNASIAKLSTSIKNAKQNKLLTDTVGYQNFTKSLDTFNRSTKAFMKDPPPFINIGIGGKE